METHKSGKWNIWLQWMVAFSNPSKYRWAFIEKCCRWWSAELLVCNSYLTPFTWYLKQFNGFFFSQPRLCWSGGKQVLCWSECFCKSSVKGMTSFNAKITLFTKNHWDLQQELSIRFNSCCPASRIYVKTLSHSLAFFLQTQDFVQRQV